MHWMTLSADIPLTKDKKTRSVLQLFFWYAKKKKKPTSPAAENQGDSLKSLMQ